MEKKKNKNFKKALSAAFPYTVPVLTGYMVLGITYGVLMRTKGYDALWAVLMSAIAYCGSMQYVAITLLTIAFDPVQAFLLSLMVNARHLFYGLSMLEKYKGLGKAKGLLIYTLFDETFSVSSSVSPPDGIDRKYFYLSISFLNYIYWVTATFIGSILGKFINFNTEDLSFVLTALFVVLFMEQMKKKENRISGAIGILGTLSGLFVFGADRMIIPSMIFILLILLAGRKKVCF